ncbi:MAG: 7-carboxy-7-deazaguanine synthase QueE [Phormidesmis sp.]
MPLSVPIESKIFAQTQALPIVETFHSIQGEGFWTGASAFFMRLAGCDVGCSWCDTKHSWPMGHHPPQRVSALVEAAIAARPFMVVITGGEPLMHDLAQITAALREAGLRVHLETSGAHPLSGQFDWIALSPKRFKPPLESIYSQADELKVVVGDRDDLLWAEATAQKVSPEAVKLLQPQWKNERGERLVFDYVRQHPEWRVSLQTHKFLGIR